MRILFVSNLYPPHSLGGMEHRCHETMESLKSRGHQCHVLTSRYGAESGMASEEGVSRVLYLQAAINHYRPVDFFLLRSVQERANKIAIQDLVRRFQPDVAFFWGMWNLSIQVPYWFEQLMPGRVAYTIASYWLVQPSPHEAYWRQPSRRARTGVLLSLARLLALRILKRERSNHPLMLRHVACVSEYVRTKLGEAGALPYGARVIYNGIDPTPFLAKVSTTSSSKRVRLIYAGGLLPHKGPHTAIEALALLEPELLTNKLHLTLVGTGHPDYEAKLRERVVQLGLTANVMFYGGVPRQEMAGILADHDIFLFTSNYEEPMARTVMEAMAVKLPVIATMVGGQSEMLLDGVNALTFEPDNPAALAAQITRLTQSPELRKRIAEAGRRTVLERFTLGRMVDEIEAWLESIAAEPHRVFTEQQRSSVGDCYPVLPT